MSWQRQSIQRLLGSAVADGGWPYHSSSPSCAEPTALACLALAADPGAAAYVNRGLKCLAERQTRHGGVAVRKDLAEPCWSTALCVLAWSYNPQFEPQRRRGVEWLLIHAGKPFKSNPAIYGHDTQLQGWSWVDGTHSWVEPTALGLLAMRRSGLSNHPRSREGVTLLLDRALADGGWNYGNSKMFGNALRPFPAQTGLALLALASEPRASCIDQAIDLLNQELPRIRTPMSLGWGVMGLAAWNAKPDVASQWLAECADRVSREKCQPMFDALLLLADQPTCPLLPKLEEIQSEL